MNIIVEQTTAKPWLSTRRMFLATTSPRNPIASPANVFYNARAKNELMFSHLLEFDFIDERYVRLCPPPQSLSL